MYFQSKTSQQVEAMCTEKAQVCGRDETLQGCFLCSDGIETVQVFEE